MNVSKEQKALKVFGIISLVFGIIGLIFAIFFLIGGGVAAGNIDSITSEAGVAAEDVGKFSALFIMTGISGIFRSIVNIIDWYCLNKVSKDATQYKPAWIVTMTSFVLSILSCVFTFLGKHTTQDVVSAVVAIVLNGIILYLINKVKQSTVKA